jgi:hypothetical protein
MWDADQRIMEGNKLEERRRQEEEEERRRALKAKEDAPKPENMTDEAIKAGLAGPRTNFRRWEALTKESKILQERARRQLVRKQEEAAAKERVERRQRWEEAEKRLIRERELVKATSQMGMQRHGSRE